jgi:hypothetical protein
MVTAATGDAAGPGPAARRPGRADRPVAAPAAGRESEGPGGWTAAAAAAAFGLHTMMDWGLVRRSRSVTVTVTVTHGPGPGLSVRHRLSTSNLTVTHDS